MKKKKFAAFFMALAVGVSGMAPVSAMLSEDEQKAAYIEKAVKEALSAQTEEETEAATEQQKEDETEAETETESETEEKTEAAAEEEETSEAETEYETEKAASQDEKIIIAIDASHQEKGGDLEEEEPIGPDAEEKAKGFSEGTSGTVSGLTEAELNLSVAEKLKKQLEDRGYEVYMTRDNKESDLSESERAKNVNASGAQILISLHANGGEDSTEKGVEVMAPSYENPYWKDRTGNIKKSNALADIILQSYCEETGLNAKGLYNVDNQILLNWSEIPSVVLEMGFMSNESDDAYMAEEEHQQEMAEGIADGIDLYFGRS